MMVSSPAASGASKRSSSTSAWWTISAIRQRTWVCEIVSPQDCLERDVLAVMTQIAADHIERCRVGRYVVEIVAVHEHCVWVDVGRDKPGRGGPIDVNPGSCCPLHVRTSSAAAGFSEYSTIVSDPCRQDCQEYCGEAHTAAIITLKSVLVTASDELRASIEPLTDYKLVTACAALNSDGDITNPDVAMHITDVAMHITLSSLATGGLISTKRSRCTAATSRRSPRQQHLRCLNASASASTRQLRCLSLRVITPTGSVLKQRSSECAASAPSRQDPATPTVATDSSTEPPPRCTVRHKQHETNNPPCLANRRNSKQK